MIRLDLSDIQGNIVRPYGRSGFPFTRHLFFTITDPLAGRRFVQTVRPRVTTADPWDPDTTPEGQGRHKKPAITLNLGFSYAGLKALDLPTRTLRLLPDGLREPGWVEGGSLHIEWRGAEGLSPSIVARADRVLR